MTMQTAASEFTLSEMHFKDDNNRRLVVYADRDGGKVIAEAFGSDGTPIPVRVSESESECAANRFPPDKEKGLVITVDGGANALPSGDTPVPHFLAALRLCWIVDGSGRDRKSVG